MAYRTVGKALPRVEGLEKVTGKTRYAADVELPGLLWGKALRSPLDADEGHAGPCARESSLCW
jgi:CO/xanthine dehydrogenase Mo-binding subunit